MKKTAIIISLGIILAGCQITPFTQPKDNKYNLTETKTNMIDQTQPAATSTPAIEKLADNITATFKTTLGDIVVELYPKSAPKTVANFVGLAKGTKNWNDPSTNKLVTDKPLYSGTIFHRVISDFMIQGGDPLGKGIGGPGYQFEDEIDSSLTFDRPYLLAMANAGPNTNGSQFFITVATTPWLNGRHTIFGKVIKGSEVVDAISKVKTGAADKPLTDVILKEVSIVEK